MLIWLLSSIFVLYARAQEVVIPDPSHASEVKMPDQLPASKVGAPAPLSDYTRYDQLLTSKYSLMAHNRTFVLPFSYITKPDNSLYENTLRNTSRGEYYKKTEAEFQISFFMPVYRKIAKTEWDFLMAYTHHSWLQAYNATYSKQFRETNYNPELFFRRFGPSNGKFIDMDVRAIDFGYMHESNGQVDELSRSWDRVFARAFLRQESESVSIILTGWLRIPESTHVDDNPAILRYRGIGMVEFLKSAGPFTLELKFPVAEKPGIEIRASYPWHDQFRFYLQTQAGFGHSLIEYNRDIRRIGIGFALENYFDLN